MLKAVRSRLTYANVVATGALFVALGGGAYALSGVPDSRGVFHGCVSHKTGLLRVVNGASACRKARGRGKHRDPGELAVSWNQSPTRMIVQKQDTGTATAVCPAGFVAVGGGGNTGSGTTALKLSVPQAASGSGPPLQWHIQSTNTNELVIAYAVCESP
jgi:hypothetical protein